jgi:hypothetical protein
VPPHDAPAAELDIYLRRERGGPWKLELKNRVVRCTKPCKLWSKGGGTGYQQERTAFDRLGYRRGEGADRPWFVFPQAWRDVVCGDRSGKDRGGVSRARYAR